MDAVTDISLKVNEFAMSGVSNAWLWGGNFLILAILTGVMILFSYKGGRGGIISLILAFYIGYAVYMVFPYTESIVAAGGTTMMKAVISVIIFGISTAVPFIFIQRLTGGGFGILSFVPRFVLSFLAAAFIMALAYHVFDVSNIYSFPEPLDKLFAPDGYFFWWFIAPLAGLLILVH
jgi:hypothetical protein